MMWFLKRRELRKRIFYLVNRNAVLQDKVIPFPVFIGFVIPKWSMDSGDSNDNPQKFCWYQEDCVLIFDVSRSQL